MTEAPGREFSRVSFEVAKKNCARTGPGRHAEPVGQGRWPAEKHAFLFRSVGRMVIMAARRPAGRSAVSSELDGLGMEFIRFADELEMIAPHPREFTLGARSDSGPPR